MQRKIKIINIASFSLIFISLIVIFVFLKFPSLLNNSFQIKNVIIEGSEKSNISEIENNVTEFKGCLLYTSPSPRDNSGSRMPSSA